MQVSLTKSESYVRYFVITAIVSIGLTSSCKKHEAQHRPPADPTSIASPTITDFNPKVGYWGKPLTVTITGTNFSNDITGNTVSIGDGAQGRIVHASSTSLTVEVIWKKNSSFIDKYPKLSGPITVETKAHLPRAQSTSTFKIVQNDGNPDITGFRNEYFEQGAGGTLVIKGINFSSTLAENIVEIDGIKATVKNASPRLLEVELPTGLSVGNLDVAVTVNGKKCNTGTLSGIYILSRHDVEQLRTFFNIRNGVKTNGELLETSTGGLFQVANLDTWDSSHIAEFENSGKNRLEKFKLPKTNPAISGQLNLSGCEELTLVQVNNHNLTSIDLTGASKDLKLFCKGNQLNSIKLSYALTNTTRYISEDHINPQQSGTPNVTVTVGP